MEFKDIAQEVRVWAALKDYNDTAYNELWGAFEYWDRAVDLPGGSVRKIAEGTSEDAERNYVIFERLDGSKIFRLDSEVSSSWDSDSTVYAPYEVVAKEVTEIKYLKV